MARTRISGAGFLLAVLLAAAISFSALMCLKEAFSLGGSVLTLLAICGAAAVLSACAMVPWRRWPITVAAGLSWLGAACWQRAALLQGAQALLFAVTTEYGQVFDGIAIMGQAGDCLLFLSFLAVPMAWITAWTVCREGNILFLLLACLPVLLLCLMIVELAPVLWLVVLTLALLLLLVTNGVREHSAREGSRLAWWLLLPTVILVMAITVIWPPADYQRSAWSERLRMVAEEGASLDAVQKQVAAAIEPVRQREKDLQTVDLRSLGPKSMTGQKVLESQSVQEKYYLRGASLGVYQDDQWQAVREERYGAQSFEGQPLLSASASSLTLRIRTERTEDLLYTTYALCGVPESAELVDDAYVENVGGLRAYDIDYTDSTGGTIPAGYDAYVKDVYTQLPDALREDLNAFLTEMGWDRSASPEKLADYVKNLARYDLNTPKLPGGEEFVSYFLRESRRGYCVHFATATAALLRTMGIPARYVTGYLVSGTAGEWVTVTEDDAHAWVEYYVSGVGWIPLEATPASRETETSADTSQTPTEPETAPEQPTPAGSEHPTPQTQPEADDTAGEAASREQESNAAGPFWWLLTLPAAAALVLLRYAVVRRNRADRCSRGHPNRRAMAWWRWLVQLAGQEGTAVEEDLICLAEKARFSQHTMTEEELEQLHRAVEARIARLKQYPMGRQLWFRFGKVLY